MSNDDDDSPLVKALPPETDYLTYLTILEYNLTKEQLPILHNILQDVTLTTNIGWDLVHLLLPLLPASELCLQDVAHLGNPREVILKVTELLEAINQEEDDAPSEEDGEGEASRGGETENDTDEKGENVPLHALEKRLDGAQMKRDGVQDGPPNPATRFQTLLSMLSTLHPRIKTKYSSRFLSTSLQAILPAYEKVVSEYSTTDAMLSFVKSISGSRRPPLPPRRSSTSIPRSEKPQSAPDPEASSEPSGTQDLAVYTRLLQSFLTHIVEIYVDSISSDLDVCGFAWTSRIQEKIRPERIVPGRKTFGNMFSEMERLRDRDTRIGRMIALACDLNINPRELYFIVTHPEVEPSGAADELPSSASDISLSYTGSLYLLSAMQASSLLYNVPSSFHPSFYPPFFNILENFFGNLPGVSFSPSKGPLLDSVLTLGFLTFQNASWTAEDMESFNSKTWVSRLQQLSALTISTPFPVLRSHTHALTSAIFHSQPSKETKTQFLQSVLENPHYEPLKPTVVGWYKDELSTAVNNSTSLPQGQQEKSTLKSTLAEPIILDLLSADLFPHLYPSSPLISTPTTFQAQIPFFLAALNLFYFLCSSQLIYDRFHSYPHNNISNVLDRIALNFVAPLKEATQTIMAEFSRAAVRSPGPEGKRVDSAEEMVELMLLDDTIERGRIAFEMFKARVTTT